MGTQTRIHVKTTKKNNKNKDGVQVQVESSISFPKVAATMMYPSLYWYLVNVRPLASTSTAMQVDPLRGDVNSKPTGSMSNDITTCNKHEIPFDVSVNLFY